MATKNYKEATLLTDSVIKIYMNLANYEINGKENSKEFQDLCQLLPKALELENKKYKTFIPLKKEKEINDEIIAEERKKDRYFLEPKANILSAMRTISFLEKDTMVSITGEKKTEQEAKRIEEIMELTLLEEIKAYLPFAKPKEKESLIYFKYALYSLFSVQDIALENKMPVYFPETMEEKHMIFYMAPIIEDLNGQLFSMVDEEINKETILKILCFKAVLKFHPYEKNIMEKIQESIPLYKMLAFYSNKKVDKICEMLELLTKRDYTENQNSKRSF